MLIEVLKRADAANKEKGDLLEKLAEDIMASRGYEVVSQLRVTGSELDLLCKDRVSGKEVYVECKAQRETLSANVLTNLLGTVTLKNYSEGWLISTGPLGKDAKGVVDEWERKPKEERSKLSFYTPERVLEALLNARLIADSPEHECTKLCVVDAALSAGEWSLLITEWGTFWACPILRNGVPERVAVFDAQQGTLITDGKVIEAIRTSDFSTRGLDFVTEEVSNTQTSETTLAQSAETAVVTVEYADRWFDYRPARPEHFVGRKKAQRDLIHLFSDVKRGRSDTRVFAVKGDSGIGKSSLLAKLRDTAGKSQKPGNLFLYAVDVRAASDSSYIHSALLSALREAANKGFGGQQELRVTNYGDPLQSESIRAFLAECSRKRELIILVFDQFEELYSKPELFSVFDTAKSLMFSAIASASSIVLGFAWKTDSSIPQEHPAYHLWHELSDHRYEITLRPFTHSEAENSLRIFENELGEKIHPELRKYLIENSQGYPWLLKKLCIHFYEQLQAGTDQHQLADRALDVAALFDRDLSDLTDAQTACLKLVAQNAPMDWFEVLQTAAHDVVQALQNGRLLIRRGDKLNLYWDIFRDYVLSGTIPTIPFTHIPQSPSVDAMIRVALGLDEAEEKSMAELALDSKLEESTVRNILHDLEQFGVARSAHGKYSLDPHITEVSSRPILARIRLKFKRHALTDLLRKNNSARPADQNEVIQYLKELNPTAQYHSRTWNTYARRMVNWLQILGLARRSQGGCIYEDAGDITHEKVRRFSSGRKQPVFLGDASPAKVVEALDILRRGPKTQDEMRSRGFRNACAVLCRFGLAELNEAQDYRAIEETMQIGSSAEAIWKMANEEPAIAFVVDKLKGAPMLTGIELGEQVAGNFDREWSQGSRQRVGNSLRQWAAWLLLPETRYGEIPTPPGRTEGDEGGELYAPELF